MYTVSMMAKRGRPKKDERGISFTIYAPISVYHYLKEKSKRYNTSLSSLIMGYVASGDEEVAQQLAKYYEEMKRTLEEIKENTHPVNLVRKIEMAELPKEITERHEFRESIARARMLYKQGRLLTDILEWLTKSVEAIALEEGYQITDRNLLRAWLVRKIKEGVVTTRGDNKHI